MNDDLWSTERPADWGVGRWFRAKVWQHGGCQVRSLILLSRSPFDNGKFYYRGFDTKVGCEVTVREDEVISYGPRAEIPSC